MVELDRFWQQATGKFWTRCATIVAIATRMPAVLLPELFVARLQRSHWDTQRHGRGSGAEGKTDALAR
jgi:hypothetical protein